MGHWIGFIVFWATYLPGFLVTARNRYQVIRPELACHRPTAHEHQESCYRVRWGTGSNTIDTPGEAYGVAVGEGIIFPVTWLAILVAWGVTGHTPPTFNEVYALQMQDLRAVENMRSPLPPDPPLGSTGIDSTGRRLTGYSARSPKYRSTRPRSYK